MADDTVQQEVDWWKIPGIFPRLATDKDHVIKVKREIVPIVFVPGIMGTRLEQAATTKPAWDPDSKMFAAKFAFLNEAQRKSLLVNNVPGAAYSPSYLRVIKALSDSTKGALDKAGDPVPNAAEAEERGWGNLLWDQSYGNFILKLSRFRPRMRESVLGVDIPLELDSIFATPVYAIGYNWTDSCAAAGDMIAKRITQIIARESAKGVCEKVIVMTHSMGGLASRAASELSGAQASIQGIVHGVQPAIGAPAAYWRMKGGFEHAGLPGPDWLIGPKGSYVTALLGNIPGGLELLPHPEYRPNGKGWLNFRDKDGNIVKTLPDSDPYAEIYRQRDRFFRLVDPELLDPANFDRSKPETAETAFQNYLKVLAKAETFVRAIVGKMHPHTYSFHGDSETKPTEVTIELSLKRKWLLASVFEADRSIIDVVNDANLARDPSMVDDRDDRAAWRDYYLDAKVRRYEIEMGRPAGRGDGTVPTLSGAFLAARSNWGMTLSPARDIDHQPAYDDSGAFAFAGQAMVLLLLRRAAERLGVKLP